ncbi:MAG: 23S rRNA (adenine(1618)-N(6))-methyltransferase RlmF [Flavobacteriales bacterium]
MTQKDQQEKQDLHPRNKHRLRYDFKALVKSCKELHPYVMLNPNDEETIDFSNPEAVKILNKALLQHFYGVREWDIPPTYLCPPIPGRADYLHYMADLLSSSNEGVIPVKVTCLDIGTGANCVYPLVGQKEYGWNFVGSDVDPVSVQNAKRIVKANNLKAAIDIRLQSSHSRIYRGVVRPGEWYDISICNPPFHASQADQQEGTKRKWKNLNPEMKDKKVLNFGGQNAELWCEGGEAEFARKMVEQSANFATNFFWFSTALSKKQSLPVVYKALKNFKALDVKTIRMAQGQKVSRIVAWTFLTKAQQDEWRKKRWKKVDG